MIILVISATASSTAESTDSHSHIRSAEAMRQAVVALHRIPPVPVQSPARPMSDISVSAQGGGSRSSHASPFATSTPSITVKTSEVAAHRLPIISACSIPCSMFSISSGSGQVFFQPHLDLVGSERFADVPACPQADGFHHFALAAFGAHHEHG